MSEDWRTVPESAATRPEELPELAGSVIGYRAWRVRGWALASTAVMEKWAPGINEAICCGLGGILGPFPGRHPAPHEYCHCGLYGLGRFDQHNHEWWINADVIGAIEAWADPQPDGTDRFFLHRTGFRAQYAKVVLLAVDDRYPRAQNAAIRALAAEHGADVCRREHLEDAAKEHGHLIPDELLQWAAEAKATSLCPPAVYGSELVSLVIKQMIAPEFHLAAGGAVPVTVAPGDRGIMRTRKTPGPPPDRARYRKGDRVRDSKGVVWQCVKQGRPGTWAPES